MITVWIDDQPIAAEENEPLAAVLLRVEPYTSRMTPLSGAPRAPYCMMGVCFECLVEIDGMASSRGCMAQAREGMNIQRQVRRPDPLTEYGQ
ncbi:putative molibdopterin-dependent oxidoreductase YjgC [Novosphingobium sp. SG751A]|uniref:(2Fe-2S)-binding protein n=1 Tax=Novosphingobium sp. SG751A TaxID=2587000 RepID=UPI0020A68954|nr:(2Fe-2S)-binding protein [Novosphingobium sp. SG751A]NOW44952.1 putative molibdopterin-dependent oxidoreductase YjgC [Novosphingobium sp. SG751A]